MYFDLIEEIIFYLTMFLLFYGLYLIVDSLLQTQKKERELQRKLKERDDERNKKRRVIIRD